MHEQRIDGGMLELKGRKELTLEGVEDILAFDDTSVDLKTTVGLLSVEGSGLRIHTLSLDSGAVFISGKIDAMVYVDRDEKKRSGLFGRKS